MTVTLPLSLVVAQWVLLFGLGALVIVMYRQFAYYIRLQRIGAESLGLPVGERAPVFDFASASDPSNKRERFEPGGRWSLVLFADPLCAGCERALHALEDLSLQTLNPELRALVVTRADARAIAASSVFRKTKAQLALVMGEEAIDLYRVRKTPFAYLIDTDGIVRAKGIAEEYAALRDLLRPARGPGIPLVPRVASPVIR